MRHSLWLLVLFSSSALTAHGQAPDGGDSVVFPGMICRETAWNPHACTVRRRFVRALVRGDLVQAELIASSNRNGASPVAVASSDNIYNAASLALPIALSRPDLFDFLVGRVDPNFPCNLVSPAFFDFRALFHDLSDARLGIVLDAADSRLPPLLLAVALDRQELFARLVRIRHGVNLEAKDSRGNNIWHYIAYFGRAELVSFVPLSSARYRRNEAGLTPLEILAQNSRLGGGARETIRALLLGAPADAIQGP